MLPDTFIIEKLSLSGNILLLRKNTSIAALFKTGINYHI